MIHPIHVVLLTIVAASIAGPAFANDGGEDGDVVYQELPDDGGVLPAEDEELEPASTKVRSTSEPQPLGLRAAGAPGPPKPGHGHARGCGCDMITRGYTPRSTTCLLGLSVFLYWRRRARVSHGRAALNGR